MTFQVHTIKGSTFILCFLVCFYKIEVETAEPIGPGIFNVTTGLPTKNETSETTVHNLYCHFYI